MTPSMTGDPDKEQMIVEVIIVVIDEIDLIVWVYLINSMGDWVRVIIYNRLIREFFQREKLMRK